MEKKGVWRIIPGRGQHREQSSGQLGSSQSRFEASLRGTYLPSAGQAWRCPWWAEVCLVTGGFCPAADWQSAEYASASARMRVQSLDFGDNFQSMTSTSPLCPDFLHGASFALHSASTLDYSGHTMQAVSRGPRQCIFCAFRSSATFSTHTRHDVSVRFIAPNRRSEDQSSDHRRKDESRSNQGRKEQRNARFGEHSSLNQPSRRLSREQRRRTSGNGSNGLVSEKPFLQGQEKVFVFKRLKPDDVLLSTLSDFRLRLFGDRILARLGLSRQELEKTYNEFIESIKHRMKREDEDQDYALGRLRRAVGTRSGAMRDQHNQYAVDVEIRAALLDHVYKGNTDAATLRDQAAAVDMESPAEWYAGARHIQRTIHLHVGPTNSGKTYHALKRLENADTGIYAGPLRLLAHEVFMRLNAAGKRCNLLTGDDKRYGDPGETIDASQAIRTPAPMTSCTVEMVPTHADLDVAVIDEIQMIGHPERAWAWTRAVLGVRAKELHLCGEERAVPVIQALMASVGDEVIVHKYERLSPLEMAPKSLEGDLSKLEKGDCIVAFSIVTIHSLRRTIEERTGKKCAIVYGSLPPETRAQQARLFNEPNNDYDYLVASNAVGMGLNLAIRRIVFQNSVRFNGLDSFVAIDSAEIKQIGGRAGRYSNAHEDMKKDAIADADDGIVVKAKDATARPPGLVTTLENLDYPTISKGMKAELQPITKLGIIPPDHIMERFARYFPPRTPCSYILIRLLELSRTSSLFFLCDFDQAVGVADALEEVEGLTWAERLQFLQAPVSPRDAGDCALARELAKVVVEKRSITVLEVENLDLDLLDEQRVVDRAYLRSMERLHKGLVIYAWLSYRFPQNFVAVSLTRHVKELVEKRIEEVLEKTAFTYDRERANRAREQALKGMLASEGSGAQDNAAGELQFEAPVDPSLETNTLFDTRAESANNPQRTSNGAQPAHLADEADHHPNEMGTRPQG
ncbi:hypothetical protein FH972_022303 [Carpinus fangiana]|uniref:RNA helicase n=1 Tax=Carpinus fangiana TaxID=176857 RepID=A0A5N6KU33_9ROSI|nr:hypothetical protein FH972_022303 [Carpinus fangiana]